MKIHKIYHGRFWCPIVTTYRDVEYSSYFGWKTNCGEVLWPDWRGTTEMKDVTCERCLKCKPCSKKKE